MKLPEPVPPVIEAALAGCNQTERELVITRLVGRPDERYTAEHLAFVLTSWGFPVSATTIRTYRRTVARETVS